MSLRHWVGVLGTAGDHVVKTVTMVTVSEADLAALTECAMAATKITASVTHTKKIPAMPEM